MSSKTDIDVAEATTEAIVVLRAAVDQLLAEGRAAQVPPSAVDELVAAAVRLHAAAKEAQPHQALTANRVSPTEALILVEDLLGAHNIRAFDLALWLSHLA